MWAADLGLLTYSTLIRHFGRRVKTGVVPASLVYSTQLLRLVRPFPLCARFLNRRVIATVFFFFFAIWVIATVCLVRLCIPSDCCALSAVVFVCSVDGHVQVIGRWGVGRPSLFDVGWSGRLVCVVGTASESARIMNVA